MIPPFAVSADLHYSELEGIEGQLRSLYEELGSQRLIDHDQDVLGLLEDLREEIFHYQVRL